MTSMTGYAYKEEDTETSSVAVEIKSLNSRFLDINVNMPGYLGRLEKRIREKLCAKIQRGKVEVFIRVRDEELSAAVSYNAALARSYLSAIRSIAGELYLKAEDNHIPLEFIISREGVLTADKETDPERYWKLIEPVFEEVLVSFCQDREREGGKLYEDLCASLERLETAVSFFKSRQPEMEKTFMSQVTARFNDLLGETADEQRIMTEVAALLVRYTINEEVVRLQSHLAALKGEMAQNPAPGRKIDFLCQEINREINTIGSKNQFVEVSQMVITAKDAVENIREQARNVE